MNGSLRVNRLVLCDCWLTIPEDFVSRSLRPAEPLSRSLHWAIHLKYFPATCAIVEVVMMTLKMVYYFQLPPAWEVKKILFSYTPHWIWTGVNPVSAKWMCAVTTIITSAYFHKTLPHKTNSFYTSFYDFPQRNVLLTLTQLKSFSNYFYKEQHLKLICCKF